MDDHPEVRAALVAREAAAYDLKRTEVRAPADGIIYQASSFRPGQMVSTGATLFTLVETGQRRIDHLPRLHHHLLRNLRNVIVLVHGSWHGAWCWDS